MKIYINIIYAVALIGGLTLFLSCSSDDNPASDPSTPIAWSDGVLPGCFSVNAEGQQVQFSQGNLQYRASSCTWRFAEHQYNVVGDATVGNVYENGVKCNNEAISNDYDGWIDLFGWGTGSTPTLSVTDTQQYLTYHEWGNNTIQTSTCAGWRTLTNEEYVYLFHDRANAATLFGLGSVNGMNGVILLPDNWSTPVGLSFTASTTRGLEWNGTMAGGISGNSKRLHPQSDGDLYYGDCVRLVKDK